MLLDLYSLVIIISDLVDSIISLIEQGGVSLFIPVAFIILYFAWRSTDVPDLPPLPNRLHFGGTLTGETDVRILNTNGPVIDSVLRSFPQRHQTQHHNHGRHGTLFLRFLRRPQSRPLLPLPIATIAPTGSRNAPNLIVYHQVSVYHHTQLPPERFQGRHLNGIATTSSSNGGLTTSTSTNSSPQNNINNNENIQQQHTVTATNNNITTTTTTTNSAIRETNNDIPLFGSNARGQSNERNNLGELNATRRSLSENNIADLDVETEESTVDVVEVEVDDLDETNGEVRVVDVNLNGDVQLDGLNLNVNSNLVTMNRNPSSSSSSSTINNSNTTTSNVNSNPSAMAGSSSSSTTTTSSNNDDQIVGKSSKNEAPSTSINNSSNAKSVNSSESDVRVILKFLNDTQIEVTTQLSEKIAEFKRRHFATELSENKVVRLIFNGRVLDDDRTTLQESGIFDQCVVHCLIVTPSQQQQRGQSNSSSQGQSGRTTTTTTTSSRRNLREGPEPGMFFIAILGIVLLFLWFVCLHFRQLFTQSAVVSLLILSVVFVFGLVALYLPVQN